jgi:hypothetical protein
MVCLKLSHANSISGFWHKSHPLALHWQTCTHYLLAPHHTTISHGVPKTEPHTLCFRFLAQILSLGLALANTQPTSMQSMHIHHIQAPPHTSFIWCAQNRATHARFQVFGPHPTLWLHISERTAPLPPPCHQHAPTTYQCHPTLPLHMVHPKPNYEHLVSGFWLKPASHWQTL